MMQSDTFISHLVELRQRLVRALVAVLGPPAVALDAVAGGLLTVTGSNGVDETHTMHEELREAIDAVAQHRTMIVIAHRLSTVRNADQVIYMDGGKLVSQGTFEEVRSEVPDFDKQSKLMGL